MKSLNESVKQALNESLEGMLQSRTSLLSKNGKADENGMIILPKVVAIGENSACIDAINTTGDIVRFDIDGSSDAVQIKFLSDEPLKLVIKELDAMIKKL